VPYNLYHTEKQHITNKYEPYSIVRKAELLLIVLFCLYNGKDLRGNQSGHFVLQFSK